MYINKWAAKQSAKKTLKDKWLMAAVVFTVAATICIAYILVSSLVVLVFRANGVWSAIFPSKSESLFNPRDISTTLITVAVKLLVLLPVILGLLRWFWRACCGMYDGVETLFYYFSSKNAYLRALKATVIFWSASIAAGFACMLPAYITFLVASPDLYQFFGGNMPSLFGAAGALVQLLRRMGYVALVFVWARLINYLPMVVIYDDVKPEKLFPITMRVFAHCTTQTIGFIFGFFGYILLSVLLIPLVFVGPYITTSYMMYVKFVVNNYNIRVKNMAENVHFC